MKLEETHKVTTTNSNERIIDYLVGKSTFNPTKSSLKKAFRKGLIYLNHKIAQQGFFLKEGDFIEIFKPIPEQKKKTNIKLEVLFEDDYLAIVYKPAGLLISGNKLKTLANALPENLLDSTQQDKVTPQPVHRLDFPTSGLVLCGKTQSSITSLGKLFENKNIQKTYIAITYGSSPNSGIITTPIDTKEAKTTYKKLNEISSQKYDMLNLIELFPATGRRHQLRKHLFQIGTPILGDKDYGKEGLISSNGLYLHAQKLRFQHPFTGEKIEIEKEAPKKFLKIFGIKKPPLK